MSDIAALLRVATQAVAKARTIILSRKPWSATYKGDRDLVSEIDLAVEQTVRSFLATETPHIGFLGEEEGVAAVGSVELLWVLDPVDGTANLVHGIPLCAVSLGLVTSDRPIIGAIDMPFLGVRYTAMDGGGSTRNGRPIYGSRCERLEDAIIAIGDYAVGADASCRNNPRLALTTLLAANVQRVRMLGTAATDLAWAADGRVDASVMFSNKPWDTTAGVVIAREAGMSVVDIDGTPHTAKSIGTIAVAPLIAPALLELVREAQAGTTAAPV